MKPRVLYVALAADHFDGAIYSLIDLIQSVRDKVEPIVLLPTKGCIYDHFTKMGVSCIAEDFIADCCTDPHTVKQWCGYILRYIPYNLRYNKVNKKCIANVVEILKGQRIDVVHSNSTILSIGFDLANALDAKFVWHMRGFIDLDFGWKPLKGWRKYNKLIRKSDAVIGITNSVLQHLLPNHSDNGYAIFDAVRSRKDILYVTDKEKYFLFAAGLIIPTKGCDIAIKAFALSNLWNEGYRLKIIGRREAKYGEQLDRLIDQLSMRDYIDLIPFTEDVRTHMAHATAFLMCSANEGLGRVTVESMFYGTPVIARNSGGTVDFIFDNKTGFLFNDVGECVKKMEYVAHSDCTPIVKQAQEFAVNNFSIEDYDEKIMKVYNGILKH